MPNDAFGAERAAIASRRKVFEQGTPASNTLTGNFSPAAINGPELEPRREEKDIVPNEQIYGRPEDEGWKKGRFKRWLIRGLTGK
jgi:hypothetical protein